MAADANVRGQSISHGTDGAGRVSGRLRSRLAVAGGLALLTVVLTAPIAWRAASVGPVNTGDGEMSVWNVSWVARALVTDPLHVYDANIFTPHRGTLAYSEANLPAGVLGLPAWLVSGNPYLTYNCAVFLAVLLAAFATYGLARHLTDCRTASFVSATLFAFAPFLVVRYAHIQLVLVFGVPLALCAMHRFVDRPTLGRSLALSAAVALAGLCSGYYGFFAGLSAATGLVYYALRRGTWRSPRYVTLATLAGVAAIVMIVPFFLPYRDLAGGTDPFRTMPDVRAHAATWRSYLASTSYVHRAVLGSIVPVAESDFPERILFPGFVALALAGVALVVSLRGSRPPEEASLSETAGFYLLLGSLAAWLSLGPDAGLYGLAYRTVPVWSMLRAPARFGVLVTLAVAVLAAIGLTVLLAATSRKRRAAAVIGALAVCELATVPWQDVREALPIPAAHRMIALHQSGAVAEFPFFWLPQDFHRHSLYMLYSTTHWHPLVNGYSDHIPDDFRGSAVSISTFPSRSAFRYLRDRGTRYVVFHMNLFDGRSREKLLDRIQVYAKFLRPILTQGDVWLYEIVDWPEPPGA
jgi:hypothetical protein